MNLSKLSIFLLMLFNNFIITDYYFTPLLYSNNPYRFYLYYLILVGLSIVLIFIIPKYKESLLDYIKKSKILKIVITLFIIIESLTLTLFSSKILSKYFYIGYPAYLFMILFISFLILMSKFKLSSIINSSYLFLILLIPFLIYNPISHYKLFDLSEVLLKVNNLNKMNILLVLYVLLNNFIYLLFINPVKIKDKFLFVLPIILASFYEVLESVMISSLFGDFAVGFEGVGIALYNIEATSIFLGNFDFMYIYITVIQAALKILIFAKIIESSYRKKILFKNLFLILILVIGVLISLFENIYLKYLNYLIYLSSALMILFLILVYRWKYGKSNK